MASEKHRGAAIIRLRQAQPAVLRRHFDGERAEVSKRRNHVVGNFSRPVDLIGVNLFAQNLFEPLQKSVALIAVLMRLFWKRKQLRAVAAAHEQVRDEAGRLCPLARRFRQFNRRALAGGHCRSVNGGSFRIVRCIHRWSPGCGRAELPSARRAAARTARSTWGCSFP
jgi:hypothetical protein